MEETVPLPNSGRNSVMRVSAPRSMSINKDKSCDLSSADCSSELKELNDEDKNALIASLLLRRFSIDTSRNMPDI